jgi:hypothetical protein
VAERLRRSTRNRLGLSRVGSSPASVVFVTTLPHEKRNEESFEIVHNFF